jgi:hypothetical protein
MHPPLFGCRLVPGNWQHGDDASLIGLAKFSMQRRRYCAERRRVDPVARPLELDAL